VCANDASQLRGAGMLLCVQPETSVRVRELGTEDLPAARRIIATAFAGEAFAVGMFGQSRLDRLVGMMGEYGDWPSAPSPIILCAEAGGVLVGVALATLPGACHLCDEFHETSAPGSTGAERIEHEFQSVCRAAHLGERLPAHAHIATVATDPFVQGSGVGSRIVRALVDRVFADGAECVALECLTTREEFYVRSGFRRVVEFDDPGGPGLRCVLMRVDAVQDPHESATR
jgi:ribosomal protein S18 acetylase RimI-like enzyme